MRFIVAAGAVFLCLAQASSAQDTVEPLTIQPQTTERWYAVCEDGKGNVLPNRTVTLSNDYHPMTGGHKHDEGTRPASAYGSLSSSGGTYLGYGGYPFTFTASRVGQKELIEVCCEEDDEDICGEFDVHVRYSDISSYSGHSTNVFIRKTKTHPLNHHGTALLKNAISEVTQKYDEEFSCYDE